MTSVLSPQVVTRPTFDLVSGVVIAQALAALEMVGLLAPLENAGLDIDEVSAAGEVDTALLDATLRYLALQGIVSAEQDRYRLTADGEAVARDKGYLVWLNGGYGEVLQHLPGYLARTSQYGVDVERNGRWVAVGSALVGRHDVIPPILKMLGEITFTHVLDLGCGSARLLSLICSRYGSSGVGVDLSSGACEEARAAVAAAGLGERVEIVEADAADLDAIPHLGKTDLVVALFLLHEFLSSERSEVVAHMRSFASRLARGAYFIVAEVPPPATTRANGELFTPEFSFIHDIMGQNLLTSAQWQSIFAEAGIATLQVEPLGLPGGTLLLAQVQ